MTITQQKNGFSVKAHQGDAKTLLAFDLTEAMARNLAGFTIQYQAPGMAPVYLQNELQFPDPSKHAQDQTLPPNSSINAPLHKFRWLHVPGSVQLSAKPIYGPYVYTVTPRYFNKAGLLLPIDPGLSVAVTIPVGPFVKGSIELGFTRGFVQSQAFVHHFGPNPLFRPKGKDLIFDTTATAGKNSAGQSYTFADEYAWAGFTAREKILTLLNGVLNDASLRLDVFAYDLSETDIMSAFLTLATQGRIRIILDNAALHHSATTPKAEDQFEKSFRKVVRAPAAILRGKFRRYAHDKVMIVSNDAGPVKVLTGSTNFSITGLYVNSNHVLVFNDPQVAAAYRQVFDDSWADGVSMKFNGTSEAGQVASFSAGTTPRTEITFSPHPPTFAAQNLKAMADRITKEGEQEDGSVIFAVMAVASGQGPVLPALEQLHAQQNVFSYGISDSPGGIYLYTPRKKTGVLVTGKPVQARLPPPFDQVPGIGLGHQIHHKYVVCGFNGNDPVVYCGSSNLALGGEEENGDNLIAIHDADIATAFAIDGLGLVDHFDFLDRCAAQGKTAPGTGQSSSKPQQAIAARWFLSTNDRWTVPYFDSNDLHCVDRQLFR